MYCYPTFSAWRTGEGLSQPKNCPCITYLVHVCIRSALRQKKYLWCCPAGQWNCSSGFTSRQMYRFNFAVVMPGFTSRQMYRFNFAGRYAFRFLGWIGLKNSTVGISFFFSWTKRSSDFTLRHPTSERILPKGNINHLYDTNLIKFGGFWGGG